MRCSMFKLFDILGLLFIFTTRTTDFFDLEFMRELFVVRFFAARTIADLFLNNHEFKLNINRYNFILFLGVTLYYCRF